MILTASSGTVSHPTWVCGLKYAYVFAIVYDVGRTYTGAWIEMRFARCDRHQPLVAPRVGAWIETPLAWPNGNRR